jgi:hypothetical protein
MRALGYGPDKRLAVKVSIRNIAADVARTVLLIDKLKEIYLDGEVEPIDNALWFAKVMRHDYTVAQGATFKSIDDPDQVLYETYTCGAENNPDGYCNPEIDKLIDRQSSEFDEQKAQAAGMGDRAEAGRGWRSADHLPHPGRHLPPALCQRVHLDGQQRLQRLALRRPLSRQVAPEGPANGPASTGEEMKRSIRGIWAITAFLAALSVTATASAQKRGGTLRVYNPESVASLSMLEEFANAELPIMGMFNNLVMFDQHVAQNSLQLIMPDLATSWSWDEDGTTLLFSCARASNGMTASRSRPGTSSAPGISISKQAPRSCASIRVNRAITTLQRSPPTGIMRPRSVSKGCSRPFRCARRRLFGHLSLPRLAARHAQPSNHSSNLKGPVP